jgi:hypothetical protein
MFRDFGRKLQRDVKKVVDHRLRVSEELSGGKLKVGILNSLYLLHVLFLPQPKPIEVQVISHHMQRYAVWFGGSMLASTVSVRCVCADNPHLYNARALTNSTLSLPLDANFVKGIFCFLLAFLTLLLPLCASAALYMPLSQWLLSAGVHEGVPHEG